MEHRATYSPDDNKLRLYPARRLDKDEYERVKDRGFKWAPKQQLFVAPMWTPSREDLLIEMCGEIGDEDTGLVDRAEERAERFSCYSSNRDREATQAAEAVRAISSNIPFGQPILVGHHSEKRARRDAEKIENGMRKAVKLWKTSEYWQYRAEGALRHARHKERPDVRARRIKKIESEKRRRERSKAEGEKWLRLWSEDNITHEKAVKIANFCHLSIPLSDVDPIYKENPNWHNPSAYDVLTDSHPALYAKRTVQEVVEIALKTYPGHIEYDNRWIQHYNNRLLYERAMLGESGGTEADKNKPEVGGACRCWCSPFRYDGGWSYIQKVNRVSVSVLDNWGNGGKNFSRTVHFDKLTKVMTKKEVEGLKELKMIVEDENKRGFYLKGEIPGDDAQQQVSMEASEYETTQSTPKDDTASTVPLRASCEESEQMDLFGTIEEIKKATTDSVIESTYKETDKSTFERFKEQLKAGVQVVSAHQLFPTPPEIAEKMVEMADLKCGMSVLEPSAGAGNLIQAIDNEGGCTITAVEINSKLCDILNEAYRIHSVVNEDFLSCNGNLGLFDRIIMNPPFENAADIKHIEHAKMFLKSGGAIIALCANGPRQNDKLKPLADIWEALPAGSFKSSGTMVSVAMLKITKSE